MAYGSNLTAYQFDDQMMDPSAYYQMGTESRKRDFQRKIAEAMRKVSGDLSKIPTEKLQKELDDLKQMREQVLKAEGPKGPQGSQDLIDTVKSAGSKALNILGTPIPQNIDLQSLFSQDPVEVGSGSGGAAGDPMRGYTPRDGRSNMGLMEQQQEQQLFNGRQSRQPLSIYGGAAGDPMEGYMGDPRSKRKKETTLRGEKPLFGNMTNLNRGIDKWR